MTKTEVALFAFELIHRIAAAALDADADVITPDEALKRMHDAAPSVAAASYRAATDQALADKFKKPPERP